MHDEPDLEVLGVFVANRSSTSQGVQKVLTARGACIETRLGTRFGEDAGLILLVLDTAPGLDECRIRLWHELEALGDDVRLARMTFCA